MLSETGFDFGWSHLKSGVGLSDSCGPLPTQDVLIPTVLMPMVLPCTEVYRSLEGPLEEVF